MAGGPAGEGKGGDLMKRQFKEPKPGPDYCLIETAIQRSYFDILRRYAKQNRMRNDVMLREIVCSVLARIEADEAAAKEMFPPPPGMVDLYKGRIFRVGE
jgi:hypothetical protein